jgi:hypothetical protein
VPRVRLFDPFGEFFQMICPCLSHLQHFEPFQSRHPISSFPGQRSHFASVPARPLSSLAGISETPRTNYTDGKIPGIQQFNAWRPFKRPPAQGAKNLFGMFSGQALDLELTDHANPSSVHLRLQKGEIQAKRTLDTRQGEQSPCLPRRGFQRICESRHPGPPFLTSVRVTRPRPGMTFAHFDNTVPCLYGLFEETTP